MRYPGVVPRVWFTFASTSIGLLACAPSPVTSSQTAPIERAAPQSETTSTPAWTALSSEQARAFSVAEIAIDSTRVCARSSAGTIACWGDQFRMSPEGIGWDVPTSTPHRLETITDARAIAMAGGLYILRGDGTVSHVHDTRLRRLAGLVDVVGLARAGSSVCTRSRDGHVGCLAGPSWVPHGAESSGDDEVHELGLSATGGLACGERGCCGWTTKGVATCIGDDAELGFTARARTLPITGITDITIDGSTACATTASGRTCWGAPARRPACELASGTLTCGEDDAAWSIADVASMTTGSSSSCAVLRSGALSCWGDNGNGSLGDGVPVQRVAPALVEGVTATRIFAAWKETCVVTDAGDTLCWGRGHGRPHDVGTAASVHVAAQYVAACGLHDGVECRASGYAGEYERISWPFPGRLRAGAIDRAGNVCVIDERGAVHCRFSLGEGGSDASVKRLVTPRPVDRIAAMGTGFVLASADGQVYQWHDTRFDEDPDFVDAPAQPPKAQALALTDAVEITAHQNGGCASTRAGKVSCWGGIGFAYDYAGRALAAVPGLDGAHGLSGNHFHVCGIVDGEVRCFGDNEYGQLGRTTSGPGDSRAERVELPAAAIQVAVGDEHTCAALVDGRVYCWGSDDDGQLGGGRVIHTERPIATVLGPH